MNTLHASKTANFNVANLINSRAMTYDDCLGLCQFDAHAKYPEFISYQEAGSVDAEIASQRTSEEA